MRFEINTFVCFTISIHRYFTCMIQSIPGKVTRASIVVLTKLLDKTGEQKEDKALEEKSIDDVWKTGKVQDLSEEVGMTDDNTCNRVEVAETMIVDEYIIIAEELCTGRVLTSAGFIGEPEFSLQANVESVDTD